MRKIVIGFSRPKGWFKPFSWAIRLVEKTPYSHVYIRAHSDALDVDLIYQASGAQVNFMGIQHFHDHAKTLYEFEFEISDEKYKQFMQWAIINSGADYSIKQPLGILLIKLFNLKRNPFDNGRCAWVCSELVGYFLVSCMGVYISDINLEIVGPIDIFKLCQKYFKPIEVNI